MLHRAPGGSVGFTFRSQTINSNPTKTWFVGNWVLCEHFSYILSATDMRTIRNGYSYFPKKKYVVTFTLRDTTYIYVKIYEKNTNTFSLKKDRKEINNFFKDKKEINYNIAPNKRGIRKIVFLFLHENICYGYSLEAPRHGETRKISTFFGLTLSALQIKTDTFANSVDPDKTARNESSHLELHCLPF